MNNNSYIFNAPQQRRKVKNKSDGPIDDGKKFSGARTDRVKMRYELTIRNLWIFLRKQSNLMQTYVLSSNGIRLRVSVDYRISLVENRDFRKPLPILYLVTITGRQYKEKNYWLLSSEQSTVSWHHTSWKKWPRGQNENAKLFSITIDLLNVRVLIWFARKLPEDKLQVLSKFVNLHPFLSSVFVEQSLVR